jgi:hypothetical protein
VRIQAVIDRMENDKAVILLGDKENQLVWPLSELPSGVHEGHILQIDVTIDEAATQRARAEAEALLQEIIQKQAK